MIITRFAPSPTGQLHRGHALAAWAAFAMAQRHGGRFLLRFEDIDHTRVREHFYAEIIEDLEWLGLKWTETPWQQRQRLGIYAQALASLQQQEMVYPCFCTRKDLAREIAAAPSAPHGLPDAIYPGTCRRLSASARLERIQRGESFAWRLDSLKAAQHLCPQAFLDIHHGPQAVQAGLLGDVVIARKELMTSYHLAVVIDDAAQGVTLVSRGEDLLAATHVHCLLQGLLGLTTPLYWHHPLVCDERGKRLAKRDHAESLRHLRETGLSPIKLIAELEPLLQPWPRLPDFF
jgi:glutamyl-Q tRNA(Asp) synthetase